MAYWIKHLVTSEMIREQVHTISAKDSQAGHLPVAPEKSTGDPQSKSASHTRTVMSAGLSEPPCSSKYDRE